MQEDTILLQKGRVLLSDVQKARRRKIQKQKGILFLMKQADLLRGERVLRFPLISLTAQRQMGPYRHVLSQKVVAGIMAIHPPYEKQSTQTITKNSRTKFWRK
jgi:hypothetical protein